MRLDWNESNFAAAFAPGNRRGANPVYKTTPSGLGVSRVALDDAGHGLGPVPGGSRSFRFTAPLLNLAGRGLDLVLNLRYDSGLWTKIEDTLSFDMDEDWLAPGWLLGFGKLIRLGFGAQTLLVDGDGTKHPFTGTTQEIRADYWRYSAHTTDGTLIDYTVDLAGQRRGIYSAWVNHPNGTVVEYRPIDVTNNFGIAYPARITDRNGNQISISYRDGTGPKLDTIVDTLGRHVQFYYDGGGLLTAITAPGLGGEERAIARFHYFNLKLDPRFARGIEVDAPEAGTIPALDAIYFPDGSGYWFGEPDSYSPYGLLTKVA